MFLRKRKANPSCTGFAGSSDNLREKALETPSPRLCSMIWLFASGKSFYVGATTRPTTILGSCLNHPVLSAFVRSMEAEIELYNPSRSPIRRFPFTPFSMGWLYPHPVGFLRYLNSWLRVKKKQPLSLGNISNLYAC